MTRYQPSNTVAGLLSLHDDGEGMDILFVSSLSRPLAEELEWMNGKQVTVRYWISDKQSTKEEAQQGFIEELMGKADVDYHHAYSEITGYLWTDEDLKIGGHDLIAELKSYIGKWLILEIETH